MFTQEQNASLKHLFERTSDAPLRADVPEDVALYEPIYKPTPQHDEPIELLARRIALSSGQSIQFFSGFRGSGKTTELLRLKQKLAQEGYLVLYANALDYINPAGPLDITDLLITIAGAFSDTLRSPEVLGKNVASESYWDRLVHFFSTTKVEISDFGIKAGEEVKLALRASPSFRQRLQAELSAHVGSLKTEVDEFIAEGLKRVDKYQGRHREVVFLFDSLEQVRGAVSAEKEVLRSVESVFANHADKLRLPDIHSIYTVPPWLKFILPGMVGIEILPGVRLWNNDSQRTPFEPGIQSLRSLLRRRLGEDGIKLLFGDQPELIDRLIDASGGHLRDLLRLVQQLILRARAVPVQTAAIERAVQAVRSQYLPIAADDALWLSRIANLRRTDLQTGDDIGRLMKFLDLHMVLFLLNGQEWYDIHPLIREEVERIVADNAPKPE